MAKPKSIGSGYISCTRIGQYSHGTTELVHYASIARVEAEYIAKDSEIHFDRRFSNMVGALLAGLPDTDGLENKCSYLHFKDGDRILVEGTIADVFAQIQVAKLTI